MEGKQPAQTRNEEITSLSLHVTGKSGTNMFDFFLRHTRTLGTKDMDDSWDVATADGTFGKSLAAVCTCNHVSALQQNAVNDRVHAYFTQVVTPNCSHVCITCNQNIWNGYSHGRPVNVKHDARCIMDKVWGNTKNPKRGRYFSFHECALKTAHPRSIFSPKCTIVWRPGSVRTH